MSEKSQPVPHSDEPLFTFRVKQLFDLAQTFEFRNRDLSEIVSRLDGGLACEPDKNPARTEKNPLSLAEALEMVVIQSEANLMKLYELEKRLRALV